MKRFGVGGGESERINVANVLMLLSQSAAIKEGDDRAAHSHASTSSWSSPERVFECKTCRRRFLSFQALGGHRASHKKPRVAGGHGQALGSGAAAKPRVHECSVCGLEFAIGQALGGHMRRHRAAAEGLIARQGISEKKPLGGGGVRGRIVMMDLNLPPLESDLTLGVRSRSNWFSPKPNGPGGGPNPNPHSGQNWGVDLESDVRRELASPSSSHADDARASSPRDSVDGAHGRAATRSSATDADARRSDAQNR